ncbi:hypothetical protein Cgig2_003133 [Carnegiea gigantea]|uniref:Uncharacterized protein n=1 Tax=Carnegiea gigantea TaxID=171969 RepID=A0A9Q1GZV5_9CARY|nr:hypothetical protein Cgig2_003133 [Carnegiea gigantea]
MGFPCSLTMDEMALYVLGNFEWYRREVAFPPPPLPSDYEDLCPDFNMAMAEEYARDYNLPKMPQIVFLTMLLNDTVKLGVLHGWMIDIMESVLKELRFMAFEVGTEYLDATCREQSGTMVLKSLQEARCPSLPLLISIKREFGNSCEGSFVRASRPPRPLPVDYRDLYPSFTLSDAEKAARDFDISEIVQATLYGMVVNDAVELSVVSRDLAGDLKSTLKGVLAEHQQTCPYGGQIHQRVFPGGGLRPASNQEENSGANDPPAPSGDE